MWFRYFLVVMSLMIVETASAELPLPLQALPVQFQLRKFWDIVDFRYPIERRGVLINDQGLRVTARSRNATLIRYNRSLRSVLMDVQKKEGAVQLDCKLFAEVAALILTGHLDDPKFSLITRYANPPPGEASSLSQFAKFFKTDFAALIQGDHSIHNLLKSTYFINKAQWVLPLGQDRYLGLSDEGPIVATFAQWSSNLVEGLNEEIRLHEKIKLCAAILESIPNPSIDRLIDLNGRGELNNWTMIIETSPRLDGNY